MQSGDSPEPARLCLPATTPLHVLISVRSSPHSPSLGIASPSPVHQRCSVQTQQSSLHVWSDMDQWPCRLVRPPRIRHCRYRRAGLDQCGRRRPGCDRRAGDKGSWLETNTAPRLYCPLVRCQQTLVCFLWSAETHTNTLLQTSGNQADTDTPADPSELLPYNESSADS